MFPTCMLWIQSKWFRKKFVNVGVVLQDTESDHENVNEINCM